MTRFVLICSSIFIVVLLVIPSVVTVFLSKDGTAKAWRGQAGQVQLQKNDTASDTANIVIPVYRTGSKQIDKVPLEEYVRGVVASEMPHDFELEALKAQAMAARTYIIRRMVERDFSDTPRGSYVTDSVNHQVYQSEAELRERWGRAYERNISKINQAVNETMGQVLTYKGRPIDATFFSTSNGYTENAEDYWGTDIPYLKSVESPWDADSPRYEQQMSMSVEEFQQKLGVELTAPVSNDQPFYEVISHTAGHRVGEVQVGGKTFSGREVRELLDLPSADFQWHIRDGQVVIQLYGYGHGVGMSQWGANGMAKAGRSAEEIVRYYYQDIDIQDYRQWVVRK